LKVKHLSILSILILAVTVAWLLRPAGPAAAQSPTPFPNCRLGVAAVFGQPTDYIGYQSLNLGAYVNYRTDNPAAALPAGLEYIQTIRLEQTKRSPAECAPSYRNCYTDPPTYTLKSPTSFAELRSLVAARPASLWLVGNEPDRRSWPTSDGTAWDGQDETTPEVYARAYFEISRAIRDVDPGARVAIGGVVQGTPARLRYLDRVWAAYPSVSGGRRLGDDVDVWNVHGFVLREVSRQCYPDPADSWGAEIPAGLDDCYGMWYSEADNASLTYFKAQIVRFRTWMRDKGERNKPLIITEGGVNLGDCWITPLQVKSFMNGALNYVLTQTDTSIGYPLDGNRLVQQFTWWSMDYNESLPPGWTCHPGVDALYDAGTRTRLPYGDNWVSYIDYPSNTEANTPRVNLLATDLQTLPRSYTKPTDPVTFTLRATVRNNGNTRSQAADGAVQVRFFEGTPDSPGRLIGTQVISDVNGCACGLSVVEQPWVAGPTLGRYSWYVQVQPLDGEVNFADNVGVGVAAIVSSTTTYYLPYISR
jgi:hypothetical protein